jgi:SAM-dependent methyltransferase
METAFGRAMLATLHGRPQSFIMSDEHGLRIEMACDDFLELREEEQRLLEGFDVPPQGAVLDLGCGAGRHLRYLREQLPTITCCGVDHCDLLLEHCRQTITAPARFVSSLSEIPARRFDLILLVGNGLGIFGGEADAVAGLGGLVDQLQPTGRILLETGNPFGAGYRSLSHKIEYGGHVDGPFPWGYADRDWVRMTLDRLGVDVVFEPSRGPGGMYFFAVASRRAG